MQLSFFFKKEKNSDISKPWHPSMKIVMVSQILANLFLLCPFLCSRKSFHFIGILPPEKIVATKRVVKYLQEVTIKLTTKTQSTQAIF